MVDIKREVRLADLRELLKEEIGGEVFTLDGQILESIGERGLYYGRLEMRILSGGFPYSVGLIGVPAIEE
jgi:hypothetical protein